MSVLKKSGEIMKKAILWTVLLVLLIAIIPISAGVKQDHNTKKTENSQANEKDTITLNENEQDSVISNVMEYLTEDADTEGKKAVVALCKNNALAQKIKGNKLKTTKVSKYSDSFYEELKKILNEDDTLITHNGDRVYIPIAKLCPGHIVESEDFPYISSVACPWDIQSSDYIKGYDYPCGISIYGINSLCSLGFEYKYVLAYFLPQFSIY